MSAAAALCLFAAATGCGTRVAVPGGYAVGLGGSQGGVASGPGTSAGQVGGALPGVRGAGAGQPVAGGAAGAGPLGGAAAGGTASGATSAASAQQAGTALGVTATTLSIGYPYSTTAPLAAFSGACSACSSFGNETYFPQLFKVLADDLNSRGGILGHKVVFQGYPYNSTGPASDSSQAAQFEQQACQHFTRDTPVFAVLYESLDPEPLAPCLTKSRVSLIAPNVWEDRKDLSSQLLYAPGAGVNDAFEHVFVRRLAAQGYFSGWNTTAGASGPAPLKIGVVNFNDPGWAGQGQQLLVALKDLGYHVAPQDVITYSAELDTQSQNVQSAVLKFRADGVTHVLGSAANGLWMYEAVGQNYFPRYGWYVGFGNDQNARSQQGLRGAMGVGIFPVGDIDPAQNPPSVGPQQTRCEQLATKAGIGWRSNQDIRGESLAMCDSVWSLAAALTRSRTLTAAGLAQGYDELGSFPSTLTFRETWNAGRHASAAMVEDIRYETSCSCFRYTGVRTAF